MSTMLNPNRLSGTIPPKSPSVSSVMPEQKQAFMHAQQEEVIAILDKCSDGIYEVTHTHDDIEDYEFVDPTKMRESQLIQDDIYQVELLFYASGTTQQY